MLGSKVSAASSLTKSKNCGEFLNLLLDTRKNRNHRYSLRSFARDLQVSPTTLCYLFKNRRKISTFSALKISQNLQVTETELDHWHSLVLLENQSSPTMQNYILRRQDTSDSAHNFQNEIDLNAHQVISEWQHLALLASTELYKSLKNKEIAKLLNVDEKTIHDSIERLKKLNLLEGEEGHYKKKYSTNTVKSLNKNLSLQQFHRDMLEKAKVALQEQGNDQKYTGTVTLAIDPKQLPELQEVFRSFIKKVIRVADKGNKKERVYHLSVNFFDLFGARKP